MTIAIATVMFSNCIICVYYSVSSPSCPLSEECIAQGFGLCRCFSLCFHRSGIGSLSEFRSQPSATSQHSVHACSCVQRPTTPSSTAPTSVPSTQETYCFLLQRYSIFLHCSLQSREKVTLSLSKLF